MNIIFLPIFVCKTFGTIDIFEIELGIYIDYLGKIQEVTIE